MTNIIKSNDHPGFETFAEIKKYLEGDSIECLLCGIKRRSLGMHIIKHHGMTTDDYKQKFGIPKSIGLICKDTFHKISAASKEKYNDKEYKDQEYMRLRYMAIGSVPLSAQINKERKRLKCEENLLLDTQRKREIPKKIILSWIQEMKDLKLTPREYFIEFKGHNICFYANFFKRINRFDLNKEYEELWEALPTHKSVASSKITQKLMDQIIELHNQLIPQSEIAILLNIAPVTVRSYLKLARQKRGINKDLKVNL